MKQNTPETASAESNAKPVVLDIGKGFEFRVQGLGFTFGLNPKP